MRDIRRPYRNSKSSRSGREEISTRQDRRIDSDAKRIKIRRERDNSEEEYARDRSSFAKPELKGDIEYTRDGRPMIKASSHFDLRPPEREIRRSREDFDVLKRSEFFNSNSRKTDFDSEEIREFKKNRNRKKKNRKVFLYTFLFLIVGALAAWTFLFDTAKIYINPKYKDVEVSASFLVFKEDILTDYASSSLSRTVLKSEPKEVNQKATGELTIYNNYSPSSQVLIKNTRFQTEDGKVFRIGESVTVPGKSGETPGKIKVKVSADAYGAEYNIPASNFTIPGFKGTARFTGFYAKSETPMKGGVSGVVQIVSPGDIETASRDIKLSLEIGLKEKAKTFKHDEYITLYDNPLIKYTDNHEDLMTNDKNDYEVLGEVVVLSIKEAVLAKMIASQALGDTFNELENVRLDGEEGLIFALDENLKSDSNILKIDVSGKVRVVWVYDTENIKKSLAGKKISTLNSLIESYKSAIDSVTSEVSPSWIRAFPVSTERIKIFEEIK